jgi:hypothetical protein
MSAPDDDAGWVASQPTEEFLAALKAGVDKAITTASPDFGAALRRLEGSVAAVPPLDLICATSFYFLTGEAGVNPEYNSPEGIFQSHVELIHAFALRQSLTDARPTVTLQEGQLEIIEAAKEVVHAFFILETARIAREPDEDKRRREVAIASMRTHAASVRGGSYYTDLSQVLAELFAPLESQIKDKLGVEITRLVEWWWTVAGAVNKRIAAQRELVHEIINLPLDDNWPSAVRDAFPRLPTIDDALVEQLRHNERERKGFVIIVSDLNLFRVFAFATGELVEHYPGPVDGTALQKVLDTWSLAFGDTADLPLHKLLTDNPVLNKPIVAVKNDLYIWALASVFNHSAFPMLESLLEGDKPLWSQYLDRRANYLEKRIAAALQEKFSAGRVITNVVWTDPLDGKEYETDVLLLIGDYTLIVECKAGRLSRPARRGRGRWLHDDIESLVVSPGRQAKRFAGFLASHTEHLNLSTRDGKCISIDTSQIHTALTLGATLEPLAGLLPSIHDLVETGLTNHELKALTHSLSLFDLLVVLEILDHPSDVLHYLSRRSELERSRFLVGDELDLLGFYLQTGFNVGPTEFDAEPSGLRVVGLSDAIDTYRYKQEAGMEAEKPRVRRTEWWEQLLSTIESRKGPRWIELGNMICNVAFEDQQKFEEAITELKTDIAEGKRGPNDFVLFENGPKERRDYFIGLIASQDSSEARQRQMDAASRNAMADREEIERVLVVGWPPTRSSSSPYQTLGLFWRGTDRPGP